MCVLFEFRQLFFFTLGTRLRISKFCVYHCKKKSDRTRCLAVSILEYNLGHKITGSEVQYLLEFEVGRAKAFWFSEGRTK